MFSMKWTNWAQTAVAYPSQCFSPSTIEEVQQIIKEARGKTLRVTGAAHSFSAVAMPEQWMMTLANMQGLIAIKGNEATFWGGTHLRDVGPLLKKHGLALSNMGDIQEQTLAGAISTGTHGTGITLTSFSDMVVEWTFVDGLGEVHTHRRGNDALSQALHMSLGLLGVLVQVTLTVVPLYYLHYEATREPLADVMACFAQDIRAYRHVEWFYFPGCELMQVKRSRLTAPQETPRLKRQWEQAKLVGIENIGFKLLSEVCRVRPAVSQKMAQFSASHVTKAQKVGLSYEIFPTPRLVKFTETEYALPLTQFTACMQEIHTMLQQAPFAVHFPIECRTAGAEVGYLSPTQNQETVFLAFHMYKGMEDSAYFAWVHELMARYSARPHWGKLNDLNRDKVQKLYPQVQDFLALRQQYDPYNIFLTNYMRKLFY